MNTSIIKQDDQIIVRFLRKPTPDELAYIKEMVTTVKRYNTTINQKVFSFDAVGTCYIAAYTPELFAELKEYYDPLNQQMARNAFSKDKADRPSRSQRERIRMRQRLPESKILMLEVKYFSELD